jgi:hypothetical protein
MARTCHMGNFPVSSLCSVICKTSRPNPIKSRGGLGGISSWFLPDIRRSITGSYGLMTATNCADRSEMDLSAIALQGLQQADAQLNAAASKIASFEASSPDGAGLDSVDLSAEVVALMSARNQSEANLATLHTASEIQKNVIDLMA